MDDDYADIEIDANYDDSYDYVDVTSDREARSKKLQNAVNPESIDYALADPDDIEDPDSALKVLAYLKTIDKGMAEEMYYQFLMEKFGLLEDDPTNLTQEEAMMVASNFELFVQYMFLCEYGFKFATNWHHTLLCDTLEDLFLGRIDIPRIVINMPPRYSKTQILIYFVAWTMGHQQYSEFIWISYSNLLSEESSFKIREILSHEKYTRIFDVKLDNSSKAKTNFSTDKKGKVYATSTGGTLTGKGAGKMRRSFGGAIIVDDGNNTLDAFSETNRNKGNSWVANTLLSRRNNMAYTPIIVVAQRIHENDISGFLLPSGDKPLGGVGEDFTHIEIPAILDKAQLKILDVPMDSPTMKLGDHVAEEYPLWPDRIPLEKLRNMRDNLPALTFYGQYQQKPFVGDGAIIKTSWMEQRERPKESEIKYRVFVLDTAQTKSKRADWSVILVACILKEGGAWIEDIHRERLEAPDLAELVLKKYRLYRPRKVYIEYKSSGIGLLQYLKREKVPLPVVPIPRNAASGDGDSICRANGISPYIKAGYITIKENATWISNFFHEVMSFPNGTHDDQVDTLTDLVAREIIPGGGYIAPIDVSMVPLNGSTFGEEVSREEEKGLNTEGIDLEWLMASGVNYRGKAPEESNSNNWSEDLF